MRHQEQWSMRSLVLIASIRINKLIICWDIQMKNIHKQPQSIPIGMPNWDVKGEWKIKCEGCSIGKGKQKNLGEGVDAPENIGNMWYIDRTSIKKLNRQRICFHRIILQW